MKERYKIYFTNVIADKRGMATSSGYASKPGLSWQDVLKAVDHLMKPMAPKIRIRTIRVFLNTGKDRSYLRCKLVLNINNTIPFVKSKKKKK